ncbi:MAG: hypothetical protein U5K69_16300 [Balneolaceae bacterium]|nr:hypothetical protein [Balneolaceae bacterium]
MGITGWFIIKSAVIAAVVGVAFSFLLQSEYTSSASLMPEYSTEGSIGGGRAQDLLQQYGGMLGIGGGTYSASSNAIRVELYPKIVQSLPFQINLLEHEFHYPEQDTTASLYDYFTTIREASFFDYLYAYTVRLPFTARAWMIYWLSDGDQEVVVQEPGDAKSDIYNISKLKMGYIEIMRSRIWVTLDQQSAVINVQVMMPDPQLSAQVARFTIDNLTDYLVEYRTEKIKTDLEYVTGQFNSAEQRFTNIQDSLAEFRDRNRNVATARAQTKEQRLQSEYDIAFNIYNSLAQQLEQTKLRLQEETPVFEVLEPVKVPTEDSSPQRAKIGLIFLVLGGGLSAGYVLGKYVIDRYWKD